MKTLPEQRLGADSVRRELERILSSPGFTRADRPSRFLSFIVEETLEDRADQLKETVIGMAAFSKKPDYDPRIDATVRIEAGRLRARLEEYYRDDGRNDPIVIELPKGGYVPLFRRVEKTPEKPESRPGRLWFKSVVVALLALVAAVAAWWQPGRQGAPIGIAVLPLENLSRDPANDYFANGLTDEIIRNLSVIEGLAVRSRTSSFALRGKPLNVREAVRQLEADYILEG